MGAGQQRDLLGQVSTCHSVTLLHESQARHQPTTVTKVLCLRMAPCTSQEHKHGRKGPWAGHVDVWQPVPRLRGLL